MECTQDNSRPSASLPGKKDVRTQEELVTDQRGLVFLNQAPMKLGKHRLNTCHAHIAKCFITLAGIINILDTEAVHMTLVWAGLDTKCRTDYTDQRCSTDEDTAGTWHT